MRAVASVAVEDAAQMVEQLLGQQAQSITEAARHLNPNAVRNAVKLLTESPGKAVIAGVGKSGIVAQKIAATFTSTGTPAISLHPGEALHGDLGIVGKGDTALLISNGGYTPELLALLPHLAARNVPVIAIVGRADSPLAAAASVLLVASVARELDPNNLAPTASTAVAMAVGDALAMTVMTVKGFTPEQFARNHPAGSLGKQLTLRVADIMRTGDQLPTALPDGTWLDVLEAVTSGGLGAVCVLDGDGILRGIVTDGDLRRVVQRTEPHKLADLRAADFMTRDPITTTPEQLAYNALQLMNQRQSKISSLPVVSEGRRCIGLLQLHDVIQSGLS
jgi:arabinose-5-phosphate isomerase